MRQTHSPPKEAYTHDDASTVDRAVATLRTELREQFWGNLVQHTRQSWQDFLERLSLAARDRYLGIREYERSAARTDARNGFYERDFVTRLGTVRVRVARTRQRAFLPAGLER